MSTALEISEIEKLRAEELDEAHAVQNAMLPGEALLHGTISVVHKISPVHDVGGDFLDYFTLSDGTLGLYLGDVAGKGLPAALYSALVVGTLRGVHKTGQSPEVVLEWLNRRLCVRTIPMRYTAIQYASYDPKTSRMKISGAGMYGPFHISSRGCHNLHIAGLPPGLFAGANYDAVSLTLEPGDSVVFATDGITDVQNERKEILGVDELNEICMLHNNETPDQLLESIFRSVNRFARCQTQHDDMTAVVFHLGR
jgi:sigma-B regulation protein RsbU (phosphoserine phosphatase)